MEPKKHISLLERILGKMDRDIRRMYHHLGLVLWTILICAVSYAIVAGTFNWPSLGTLLGM